MSDAPAGDSPFRGGFRLLTRDDGGATVDVWGAEPSELLPRAVEGALHAAGEPELLVPAPVFRIEARASDLAGLLQVVVSEALRRLADDGRYARVATCRSVMSVEPGGTLEPGVAAVLLCEGGLVDAALRRIAPTDEPFGVWEENGILRARFHVREVERPVEEPPD